MPNLTFDYLSNLIVDHPTIGLTCLSHGLIFYTAMSLHNVKFLLLLIHLIHFFILLRLAHINHLSFIRASQRLLAYHLLKTNPHLSYFYQSKSISKSQSLVFLYGLKDKSILRFTIFKCPFIGQCSSPT